MFFEIFKFELSYRFRQRSTYIYFGLLFLVGFVFMAVEETFFGPPTGGKIFKNAPQTIAQLMLGSAFAMFIVAPITGTPIFRDFKEGIHPLFFTTPLKKAPYLGGRFLGALAVTFFVISGTPVGAMLGTVMPWNDAAQFAPFNFAAYWKPFIYIAFVNVFFCACIFFAAYAFTRNSLVIYVGGVTLFVLWSISRPMTQNIGSDYLAGLLEPFGFRSWWLTTRYWSIADQNAQMVPISEFILPNRLLWGGIGLAVLLLSCLTFRMGAPRVRVKKLRSTETSRQAEISLRPGLVRAATHFSTATHLGQWWQLVRLGYRNVVRAVPFLAIALFGVADVIISAYYTWQGVGNTFPVTYQVIGLTTGTFQLYFLILTTVYAGELVWRERDLKMQGLVDTLPVPNWVPFAGKFVALLGVMVTLLLLLILTGVGIQAWKGYYHFELDQYATNFLLQLATVFQLCALSMAVQVLVNQKYVGYAIMVVYHVAFFIAADGLGLEHVLIKFGSPIAFTYSDMNGYGHFVRPLVWVNLYYGLLALLAAVVSNLFWVRGAETSARHRRRLFGQRFSAPARLALGGTLLLAVLAGGYVFYNTNVRNDYRSTKEQQAWQADYEKQYKRYEALPQPKFTDVRVNVDIYPEERYYTMRGTYRFQNKSSAPQDTLVLNLASGKAYQYDQLQLSRPHTAVLQDDAQGLRVYRLARPLLPGDTMSLHFDYTYRPRGFKSRLTDNGVFSRFAVDDEDRITRNGTFIDGVPINLGYQPYAELEEDDVRKKNGLPEKERMARVDDQEALQNNSWTPDADQVSFETVISTAADQIAMAPGYLQREWTAGGRRYFHYRMDRPIANFYSFLSARYEVKKTTWRDAAGQPVSIEVYYHPTHAYNVDRMVEAAKKSLDYYTKAFGPYQYRQLRILEFPRYKAFAQSFPNTVPFSEGIGFISDVRDKDQLDFVFFLTAHEVAHQWWGHQVVGGNVQGSSMLSESLAEYAALMVYEQEYGRDRMAEVLREELMRYRRGRREERKKEMPLMLVENQPYIHYNKGGLVMYAMRDYLGEDRFNGALRRFLEKTRYQAGPYTNAVEFVDYVRAATPDSLRYLIHDLFETITLLENKLTAATYTERPDGKYEVKLVVEAQKFRADSLGNETEIPIHDWIDVGVFGPDQRQSDYYETSGKPLYFRKHLITQPNTEITVVVDEAPHKAGFDPYSKLIDKDYGDNVKVVKQREAALAVN